MIHWYICLNINCKIDGYYFGCNFNWNNNDRRCICVHRYIRTQHDGNILKIYSEMKYIRSFRHPSFAAIFLFRDLARPDQGCQMAHFQTKNPNLGKFWRVLEWERLVYSMAILNILGPFGTVFGHFVTKWQSGMYIFWYIVSRKIWHSWAGLARVKISSKKCSKWIVSRNRLKDSRDNGQIFFRRKKMNIEKTMNGSEPKKHFFRSISGVWGGKPFLGRMTSTSR
jgi:hypothetical protein